METKHGFNDLEPISLEETIEILGAEDPIDIQLTSSDPIGLLVLASIVQNRVQKANVIQSEE